MDLGEEIKALRESRGLSQSQLAAKARVSIGQVRKLEQGHIRDINLSTAARLADVLNVSVDRLAVYADASWRKRHKAENETELAAATV